MASLYDTLGVPQGGAPLAQLRNAATHPLAPLTPSFGGVTPSQQAAAGRHYGNITRSLVGHPQTQANLARAKLGGQVGQGLYGLELGGLRNRLAAASPWMGFAANMTTMPFNMMPELPVINI
jgi:hypothetical protein